MYCVWEDVTRGCNSARVKKYRPISNLSFISKLLERVVASQLHAYLNANGMYEPFQSGYKKGHCTETAFVRVQNDILLAIDQRKVVMLLLLDPPAAFEMISHDILFYRLEHRFGISGEVLGFMCMYVCLFLTRQGLHKLQ